jgi:hypothetical protein
VGPFLDPVTKSKIEFVYSKDVKKAEEDGAAAAAAPAAAAGAARPAGVTATVTASPPADTPAGRFLPYLKYYRSKFDYDSQVELLSSFGWRK